jgi:hypothetical protein
LLSLNNVIAVSPLEPWDAASDVWLGLGLDAETRRGIQRPPLLTCSGA